MFTSAFSAKPRTWTQKKLAESICRFDKILERATHAEDKLRLRSPHPISTFLGYMIDVHQEAENCLDEKKYSSKVKLGGQKGSVKLQDNVDLTILKNDSFDVENCGYCRHCFVIPIGLDINKIHKYNMKVVKAHNGKMKEWSNTQSNKRGPRPRPVKALSQHLACMCCKMACMDNTNGLGCLKCETACKNAIERDSDVRPFFDKDF